MNEDKPDHNVSLDNVNILRVENKKFEGGEGGDSHPCGGRHLP